MTTIAKEVRSASSLSYAPTVVVLIRYVKLLLIPRRQHPPTQAGYNQRVFFISDILLSLRAHILVYPVGVLPEATGQLVKLVVLDLSYTGLSGTCRESTDLLCHFSKHRDPKLSFV